MPDKQSPLRNLLTHLWPHAVWDGIHWLIVLGGATLMAAVVTLFQTLRHHWDIVAILSVFAVAVLMLVLANALIEKKRTSDTPVIEGHPVPMPTFRTIEEWNDALKGLKVITNRKFTHEQVTLDGNQFIGCSFVHVNLFYNGTAPFFFVSCDFDEDTKKHFHSRNPAMAQWVELLRTLGMLREGLNFALTPVEPGQ
jgi:hypothetical protein